MEQRSDDFFENATKASDKGKFLKLPRYQKDLKCNFDGLYIYNTRIAHLDMPHKTIIKIGRWSVTSTTHYNYASRFLEDA